MSRTINDAVPEGNAMFVEDSSTETSKPDPKAEKTDIQSGLIIPKLKENEMSVNHLRKKHLKAGEFCACWAASKSIAEFVKKAKSKYGVDLKAGSVISRAARMRVAKKPTRLPYFPDEQNQNDAEFLNDKYGW